MAEALAPILQIVAPAMAAAGAAGNIYSGVEAGKVANLQKQQLQNQLSYQNDPSKLAALVKSLKLPMSESMIQALARSSGAQTGAAGLGDSPGLASYIAGQAAAPYENQANQEAIQQALGLIFGGNAGTPKYPTTDLSSSFSNLQKYLNPGGGNTTTVPGFSMGSDFTGTDIPIAT